MREVSRSSSSSRCAMIQSASGRLFRDWGERSPERYSCGKQVGYTEKLVSDSVRTPRKRHPFFDRIKPHVAR